MVSGHCTSVTSIYDALLVGLLQPKTPLELFTVKLHGLKLVEPQD